MITRGLYTFYPLFEVQKRFFKGIFFEILSLCMASIQERVMMARIRYLRLDVWLIFFEFPTLLEI